ncbi:DUF3630 family protein [Ferrimonas pelagia]|uniref:DUF3630 family protein n=1 Tax=Ferrimonas pelagia TaxID=1177826 RepID=A0ABP9EYA2_9GAMM
MESVAHALLLKLAPPHHDPQRAQLLWSCPLSQEQVTALVPLLCARLDCQLGGGEIAADRLFWPLRFEESELTLHFEAMCETLWIQAESGDPEGAQVIAYLATLAQEICP